MMVRDDAKIKENCHEQSDQEYDHLERYICVQVVIYLGVIPLRQVNTKLIFLDWSGANGRFKSDSWSAISTLCGVGSVEN